MFTNRIAVVTGAGSGMGRAIAQVLARDGATVYCTDINGDSAQETARGIGESGGQAVGRTLDIADAEACAALAANLAAAHGDAAILVNNAGITLRSSVDDPDALGWWQRTMQINATGAYNMIVPFAPQLRRTRGAIVNIASTSAFVTTGVTPAYCASKGAMVAMSRALAVELGPSGVRVNVVAPGLIATPMSAGTTGNPEVMTRLMARTPLQSHGEPEDIAEAVAFLASDRARYITGAVLPVDGGLMAA